MKKIPVAVLGATGSVGQKFIELLQDHPWFEIAALTASERSAGRPYGAVVRWMSEKPLPAHLAEMTVEKTAPGVKGRVAFSGLDAAVAGEAEEAFAQAGYAVVSNARNHRMRPDVPLLIPEVNADHGVLIEKQPYESGFIVTNPNCSTVGLTMALKPLDDAFGVEAVQVVTMQALSGGGYPGVPSMDIIDNVVPHIGGEEEKMESEPLKLLGHLSGDTIIPATMAISAQCNRVAVRDGHLESIAVKLKKEAAPEELIRVWSEFRGVSGVDTLPSAPVPPLYYGSADDFPQPRLERLRGNGMTVSLGRLKKCPVLDYRFMALVHNTIRGAAGGAILNAEWLYYKGYLGD